jgi:tRNA-dihydrouridine synthase 4
VDLSLKLGTAHTIFHHHLMYMCERIMSKAEKRIFNTLPSTPAVLDYLQENYDVKYEKG